MRADIVPGARFPDYELTDHARRRRRLSELQGIDPMILLLSRGHFCPKDHQQHLELAAFYPKIAVAYTKIVTIATDNLLELNEFRDSVGAQWTFLSDSGSEGAEGPRDPGVHRSPPRPDDPAHARARARTRRLQDLQRLLVLGPAFNPGPPPRICARSHAGSGRTGTSRRPACARNGRAATARDTTRTRPRSARGGPHDRKLLGFGRHALPELRICRSAEATP